MRKSCLFLIPFLPLIFLSCNASRNNLAALEPILRDKPDSVLCVLSSMESDHLNRRASAYHALLTSAALDINHYNLNDSLMNYAHQYYRRHGSQHEKMMDSYYYGRLHRQNNNGPEAILSLYKAAELARREGELLYLGLSLRNISEIFSSEYEDAEAIKEIEYAISVFEEANLPLYAESARLSYANILQQTENYAKADSVYQIIISNSKGFGLIKLAYRDYAYMLDIKTPDDAKNVLALYQLAGSCTNYSGHLARMAYAYSFINQRKSDSLLIEAKNKTADIIDTARISHHRYLIEKNQHKYKEAIEDLELVTAIQDSIVRLKLQQSLISSLNEVYRRDGEIERLRTNNTRIVALLIIGITSFTILVLCYLLAKSRKKRRELFENISETKRILQEREDDNLRLVKTMMLSKISVIEEAAQKYEEAKKTREEEAAYRELLAKINTLRNDGNLYREIETALDTYHHGIISKVRQDYPDLTDYMFQLLLLFFAHIPQSTISLLRKSSESSIKTAKYRLRKLFRESGSSRKNDYLYLLDS